MTETKEYNKYPVFDAIIKRGIALAPDLPVQERNKVGAKSLMAAIEGDKSQHCPEYVMLIDEMKRQVSLIYGKLNIDNTALFNDDQRNTPDLIVRSIYTELADIAEGRNDKKEDD